MKIKYILIALLLLSTTLFGQQENVKVLSVGDNLPDILLPKIIHSPKTSVHTAEYKDRLLIFDFWATTCSNCIEALPKMDSLQKKFGPKLKIFPVTPENREEILSFWERNKYTRKLSLPSVVEDQVLQKLFPRMTIPHEVWIYKGKVIAITGGDYVDANNIAKVLNGDNVENWPLKYDFYSPDRTKSLFNIDSKQANIQSTFIRYSAISDFKQGIGALNNFSDIQHDTINKTVRTWFLNYGIFSSYFAYWSMIVPLNTLVKPSPSLQANQIVWEVVDRSPYRYEKRFGYQEDWIRRNGICFESVYPDTGQDKKVIYHSVINDLDRLLGLHVRWEKRKENVLLLLKKSIKKTTNNNVGIVEGKYRLSSVADKLNAEEQNPYVFDETGDKESQIQIEVKSWKDIGEVKRKLELLGYTLEERQREVDKLVFSEVDGGRLLNTEAQSAALVRMNSQKEFKAVAPEENVSFLESNKKKLGVNVTSSGLQYRVLKEGYGSKSNKNSKILFHYEGSEINGHIFGSTYSQGLPMETRVDKTIKGFSEALQLMREGAKWELYIPAELAYGEKAGGNWKFPPNSTLVFTVELIKVLD